MWRIWETRESWSCLVSQLCAQRGAWLWGRGICHILHIQGELLFLFSFKQCWAASMITSYQEKIITLIIVISSRWQMKSNCAELTPL